VDYTYHNQLTLNSVLGNFPESYALDTAYDPAGCACKPRMDVNPHTGTFSVSGDRIDRRDKYWHFYSPPTDESHIDASLKSGYTNF
jgi:hypothetical protein